MKLNLDPESRESIAKMMALETFEKKGKTSKKAVDLSRFDWSRVEFANPRDIRAVGRPCEGHHEVQAFGRGSQSGINGHAMWLCCSKCALRLLYCPTIGSKGSYRSAGPLSQDVKTKVENAMDNSLTASQLNTHVLALEAAESSALRKVEQIRKQKEAKGMGKSYVTEKPVQTPAAKAMMPPPTTTPPKKEPKRVNNVPAEVQEHIDLTASMGSQEDWTKISP